LCFEPVPDDRLIESPHRIERPQRDFVRQRFELLHRASEQIYPSPLDEQEVIDLNVKEEWADHDAGISALAWGMAYRWLAQQDRDTPFGLAAQALAQRA